MKKLIPLLLMVCFVFSLTLVTAGCSTETKKTETKDKTEEKDKKDKKD